jgi:general secretion pathway protein G
LKKSFSILEIIFIVVVISVLATFILSKTFLNLQNTNIKKLSGDVALICGAINKNQKSKIISNGAKNLDSLDDNDTLLFNLILKKPIVAKYQKAGCWSKVSQNIYCAWVDSKIFVKFIYDKNKKSFSCNLQQKYCKELSQ